MDRTHGSDRGTSQRRLGAIQTCATSISVTDLPDVKCRIVGGEAPAFLRFEGPLYFMGPIWRIELN